MTVHTDTPKTEDRVRAVAYSLWLAEGRPEGRAEAHWLRANELVAAEAAAPAAPSVVKKAAAAKSTAAPTKTSRRKAP